MADVEFKSARGETITGYMADTDRVIGNVVVIHEWWGVNDQIRAVADRLAGSGYRAFIPDLYDGKRAQNADEAGALMGALDWRKAVGVKVRASEEQLRGMGGKVGILGFCMGGAVTLASVANLPGAFDAAVCFYGVPPSTSGVDLSSIKTPLLAHFATKDQWCNAEVVGGLEAQLKKGNVPYELHMYAADHAFFNEARKEVHDPAASKLAWDRSLKFLEKNLK